ncbi:MAG: CpaD family pilus assembly protein [Tsuneonella sp.]
MPINRKVAGAIALSLSVALVSCGGMATNRSLYSTKQAVVDRTSYVFDVQSNAGGLPISEKQRLASWFDAMDLRYGDRVSLDDPMMSAATRADVAAIAGRHGLLVSDGAPVTQGYVQPGQTRVVITRSNAAVPGCPDWSAKSDMNFNNGVSPGYGCAVNGNMAAMVANPEDLLHGQEGSGETVVMSSTKAIETYRKTAPTGAGGLKETSTSSGSGGK